MDTILSAEYTTAILRAVVNHLGKWNMINIREKKLPTDDICDISAKGAGAMNVRAAMCRLNRLISAIINFYHR